MNKPSRIKPDELLADPNVVKWVEAIREDFFGDAIFVNYLKDVAKGMRQPKGAETEESEGEES